MAGAVRGPHDFSAVDPLEWLAIEGPDTVAAALQRIGRWSLDGAPRRFDAEDWWFRAEFEAPDLGQSGRWSLTFAGLAGDCTVWLNGEELLASDNMHVAHECPAPRLATDENILLMRFASLDAKLKKRRPPPRWRAPMVEHQQLRWSRVSLLGRTPGWSPPAPVIGPWRPIEWRHASIIEVSELRLRTDLDQETGWVTFEAVLATFDKSIGIASAALRVSRDGVTHEAPAEPAAGGRFTASLAVSKPDQWWPHTHGVPALYDAEVVVDLKGRDDPVRIHLGRIGFRTLTVNSANGDFEIRVNGVPTFCRGANWTPIDPVSPAASAEATRAALAQIHAAGLNMVRVNGCMVYEDDAFFEACDELGLLVWQDFMFANMDYPADDPVFAASVREETRQQLERWQSHPSLAVICGNSEVEQQAAMWGAPRESWGQSLFDTDLAALARDLCPGTTYWPSSAHGGSFPHQNNIGTTSYYGVGAYLRPLEDARRSDLRFASECLAFANVPPPATIARMPGGLSLRTHHSSWKARTPRDLGAGWDFEDVRDHYVERLYGVDPIALRHIDHDRYLQLSRASGAEIIEATMSEWRRPGSRCRGALVWYLRDLWAGAGWGLLDERGAPKAAFHGLRRASAPIHLFFTDEGTNGLALHLVNDPAEALAGRIELSLYRDDGLRLETASRDVAVAGHDGQSWTTGDWFDGFVDLTRAYRFGPTEHALVAATFSDGAGRTIGRAFHFPEGRSADRRRDVGLGLGDIERGPDGVLSLSVSAQTIAQSVYFDAGGYVAEEEYFHLVPRNARTVLLRPSEDGVRKATRIGVMALNAWSGASIEVPR